MASAVDPRPGLASSTYDKQPAFSVVGLFAADVPPSEKRPLHWLWLTLAFSSFCILAYGSFPYIVPGPPPPSWMPMWILGGQLFCLVLYFLLCGLIHLADRLPPVASWAMTFIGAAAAAFLSSYNSYSLILWFERDNPLLAVNYLTGVGLSLSVDIWLFGFFAAAQKLLLSLEKERMQERRLSAARLAAGQAQLRALRYQVNPHFLFNTLNAISSLISCGRGSQARAMMQQLSEYLRSSEGAETETQGQLADELAGIEAYLAIERVRFGNRLDVRTECPEWLLRAEIPSLLLQPLIENAVKHAVAPSGERVTISVRATAQQDRLLLTVEDNGKKGKSTHGLGVGHRNIATRLRLLYGNAASLQTESGGWGFRARITLPLVFQLSAPPPANDIYEEDEAALSSPRK